MLNTFLCSLSLTPHPSSPSVYNDGDATLKKTLGEAMLKSREGGGGGGMGGMGDLGGGMGGGFGDEDL